MKILIILFCRLQNVQLKDTETRNLWSKFSFPIEIKIHLFNVTNAYEVANEGAKPIVQEVGPYFYEWVNQKNSNRNDIEILKI